MCGRELCQCAKIEKSRENASLFPHTLSGVLAHKHVRAPKKAGETFSCVCTRCVMPACKHRRVVDGNAKTHLWEWAPRTSRSHGPEGRGLLLASRSARALCLRAQESEGWWSARGQAGRARAVRAMHGARASSRGLTEHASVLEGRGFERGRACKKSFGER